MTRVKKRWAWCGAALACVLAAPGVAVAATTTVGGPLNILLVGIDPRDDHTAPLADSIIVAHVPADRSAAYLFSIPRDLVVTIPAFAKSGSPAQRAKINAAMALGSRVGERRYNPAQGYELLSRTVGEVTGIKRFDAGAVLNFGGFTELVEAIGGISVAVDQTVVSEHRKPDGSARDRLRQCPGHDNCHRPYVGAQKTYPRSDRPVHFKGWEALDYVRQRYGLPHSDYDRQRHQRQFVTALAKKLKRKVVADPAKLLRLTGAVGGGHGVTDWAQTLKVLRIRQMTGLGLPGSALFEGGVYRGEKLPGTVGPFFDAVDRDRIGPFLAAHPGVVSVDR
jgi:anionic cell wall polymer biosynthesis LytR-Cps2A-Psr (LCP) family protein